MDDETPILDAIGIIFEDMGLAVRTESAPFVGTRAALEADHDLVLTDIRMPRRRQ